jgi:hypothetical protein
MSEKYDKMWAELGLDISAHDGLRIKELKDAKTASKKIIGTLLCGVDRSEGFIT